MGMGAFCRAWGSVIIVAGPAESRGAVRVGTSHARAGPAEQAVDCAMGQDSDPWLKRRHLTVLRPSVLPAAASQCQSRSLNEEWRQVFRNEYGTWEVERGEVERTWALSQCGGGLGQGSRTRAAGYGSGCGSAALVARRRPSPRTWRPAADPQLIGEVQPRCAALAGARPCARNGSAKLENGYSSESAPPLSGGPAGFSSC
jgi:hypothetical protein